MENSSDFLQNLIKSLLAIGVGVLVYFLVMHIAKRAMRRHDANLERTRVANRQTASEAVEKVKKTTAKARSTYAGLFKSVIRLTFIAIVILAILSINGVDVGSLLAGLGILSVVIGLAVQDVLKDIIRGVTIVTEKYFQVGDIVTIGNYTGKVISIGMLTTKMIDDNSDGAVVSISNRNIVDAESLPSAVTFSLLLPKEHPMAEISKILTNAALLIEKEPKVRTCEYLGVSDVESGSLRHLFKITCSAADRSTAKRAALKVLLTTLEEEKVPLPYNSVEIKQN